MSEISGREPSLPVPDDLTGREPGLSSDSWVSMCWHIHGVEPSRYPWHDPLVAIPPSKIEVVRRVTAKLMEYPLMMRDIRLVHIYDIVHEQFLIFMEVSEQKANAIWEVLHRTFRYSSFYRVAPDKYDQIVQLQQQKDQMDRGFQWLLQEQVDRLKDIIKGK